LENSWSQNQAPPNTSHHISNSPHMDAHKSTEFHVISGAERHGLLINEESL
jgi:hypothetical protein